MGKGTDGHLSRSSAKTCIGISFVRICLVAFPFVWLHDWSRLAATSPVPHSNRTNNSKESVWFGGKEFVDELEGWAPARPLCKMIERDCSAAQRASIVVDGRSVDSAVTREIWSMWCDDEHRTFTATERTDRINRRFGSLVSALWDLQTISYQITNFLPKQFVLLIVRIKFTLRRHFLFTNLNVLFPWPFWITYNFQKPSLNPKKM